MKLKRKGLMMIFCADQLELTRTVSEVTVLSRQSERSEEWRDAGPDTDLDPHLGTCTISKGNLQVFLFL